MEVYVDDSIVKSVTKEAHINDLEETFATLCKYQIKLNPKKCVFRVRSGKFLGFMIRESDIDANSDKIRAMSELPEPKSIWDILKLTSRMAVLTRFVSKSAEKALPFFKVLKGNKNSSGETSRGKPSKSSRSISSNYRLSSDPRRGISSNNGMGVCKTKAAVLLVEKEKQ